jgi:hypothetical protein
MVPRVLQEHGAFVCMGHIVNEEWSCSFLSCWLFLDCLLLRCCSFKMLRSLCQFTQHHIPEDLNSQIFSVVKNCNHCVSLWLPEDKLTAHVNIVLQFGMSGAIYNPFICLHGMHWDTFTLLVVIVNGAEEGNSNDYGRYFCGCTVSLCQQYYSCWVYCMLVCAVKFCMLV